MKKDRDANFLPSEEKKQANEVLQKQPQQGDAEMKLVIPEMEVEEKQEKKKESFWERRKRKKQEKMLAKMRKKGETGAVKEAINKEQTEISETDQPKAELFGNMQQKKEEPKKQMPPKVQPEKKKEEPPKKEQITQKPQPPKQEMKQEEKKSEPPKPSKVEEPKKEVEKKPEEPKEKKPERDNSPKPMMAAPQMNGGGKKMHQPENQGSDFDGPSVNLVPDTMMPQGGAPNWILGAVILVFTIAVWVIIGGIGVSRAQRAEAQAAQKMSRISQVNKLINEFSSGKEAAQTLQKQFNSVEDLITNHVYWTPVLKEIEENTISDVYYISINTDISTKLVSLRAISKNYAAAARQIRSFELIPDVIQSVSVGEVRVENQPDAELPVPIVAFDLELTLADDIFNFTSLSE